mmetsp:Transcript_26323/g.60987  ORF Transcript_26323/g.60987 Transcript_26323/m.60987 type:complete len:299 (-) Transcript_26323:415-1311(-)
MAHGEVPPYGREREGEEHGCFEKQAIAFIRGGGGGQGQRAAGVPWWRGEREEPESPPVLALGLLQPLVHPLRRSLKAHQPVDLPLCPLQERHDAASVAACAPLLDHMGLDIHLLPTSHGRRGPRKAQGTKHPCRGEGDVCDAWGVPHQALHGGHDGLLGRLPDEDGARPPRVPPLQPPRGGLVRGARRVPPLSRLHIGGHCSLLPRVQHNRGALRAEALRGAARPPGRGGAAPPEAAVLLPHGDQDLPHDPKLLHQPRCPPHSAPNRPPRRRGHLRALAHDVPHLPGRHDSVEAAQRA